MAVAYNSPPEFTASVDQHPIRPGRHSGSARAALERRTIHIPDVRADPEYTYGAKDAEAIRTVLGVPILKGEDLLGVMMIYHLEGIRPFTEKQIAFVETFADQAAIAIENARLFEAEQERTRELTKSLQQQTATSEVLRVISTSSSELEPVFGAILANGARLCEASFGILALYENGAFHVAGMHNVPEAYAEYRRLNPVINLGPQSAVARMAVSKGVIHYLDYAAQVPDGRWPGSPGHVQLLRTDAQGQRTCWRDLHLPPEVRPFTDKQIALVENFADQAVIAVEYAPT